MLFVAKQVIGCFSNKNDPNGNEGLLKSLIMFSC